MYSSREKRSKFYFFVFLGFLQMLLRKVFEGIQPKMNVTLYLGNVNVEA